MGVVRSILKAIDHVLAPPVCPVCRETLAEEREDGRLCGRCRSLVEEDGGARRCRLCGAGMDTALDFCADCAAAKRPWKAGTCAFPYEGELAQWILAYKFGGRTAMAPFFIREMTLAWKRDCGDFQVDAVVPIPLHWRRLCQRGFNQAEILARGVAKGLGVDCLPALKRVHSTGHQARLAGASRRKNLRNAFRVARVDLVDSRRILVVDDVFTTGSTLSAACQALLNAGAAETAVLAMARA